MKPQQVVSQFLQLPAEAQQIVADLIAYLDRRETSPRHLDIAAMAATGEGAIMLPPLVLSDTLTSTSENPVIDPDLQGGKFAWDKPDFDFREWQRQIWERPKAQL